MEFEYVVMQKDGRDGVRFPASVTPLIRAEVLDLPAHTIQVGSVEVQFSNLVTARETTVVESDGTITKTHEDGVEYYCAQSLTVEDDGEYRWLLL